MYCDANRKGRTPVLGLLAAAMVLGTSAGALAQVLYCGDGIVTPELNEECDDGNTQDFDGCDAQCYIERCGDGVVQPANEECDDGNAVSGDGCSAGCEFEHGASVCGDGIRASCCEQCDDGNTVAGDGCSPVCKLEICGNGIVDPNEECDDPFVFVGTNPCCQSCQLTDQGDDPPTIECNASDITPPDAPITFRATGEQACPRVGPFGNPVPTPAPTISVKDVRCWAVNGAGKIKDKGKSCVVAFGGDAVTIMDSGGVDDNIEWTIEAVDRYGNTAAEICTIHVDHPNRR